MKVHILRARAQTKKDLMIYFTLYLGFFFFTGLAPANVHAENSFVTIGTGAVTGVYYPTGRAIVKIVNKKGKEHGVQVKVESTGGSVFNVNAIIVRDLEFGIVQSDRQYQAWHGIKDWKDRGPQKKLRSICSFHPESVVLVAGDDTGIETLIDLKGKHINIGNLGSGPRGNAIDAMHSCGIYWRRELSAEGIRAADSAKLLQDGRIDAFFYTVGHPNDSINEATSGTRWAPVEFVAEDGEFKDISIDYLQRLSEMLGVEFQFKKDVTWQEGLRNIGRHARVTDIQVQLSKKDNTVYFMLKDNGIGFHLDSSTKRRGLRLASMEERARLVIGRGKCHAQN